LRLEQRVAGGQHGPQLRDPVPEPLRVQDVDGLPPNVDCAVRVPEVSGEVCQMREATVEAGAAAFAVAAGQGVVAGGVERI